MQERIYPYYCDGRFYNYPGEHKEPVLVRSLYMYLTGRKIRNSRFEEFKAWHQKNRSIDSFDNSFDAPQLTWIGHSTFLVAVFGLDNKTINILTDPIFGSSSFLFPRLLPPPCTIAQLPRIDCVIISHNHRDHMDRATLQAIAHAWPNCIFLVPCGDAHWLERWGITKVIELSWWSQYTISGVTFTFLPAVHWSQRSLFDYNRSLWGSWMIDSVHEKIYFAGDSAYGKHFKLIAQEFNSIDRALMPIGPCEPHAWMKASHMNAQQAGQAFLDLKAHHFVPMHWATFKFGCDDPLMAIEQLITWWQQHGPTAAQLHALTIGQKLALGTIMPAMQSKQPEQTI